MERKHALRSGLILLELIASILIFAVAGSVCIRVLTRADTLSRRAESLTEGVNITRSAHELIAHSESGEEALRHLRQAWPQGEGSDPFTAEFPSGTLKITPGEYYIIMWYDGGEAVHTLQTLPGWEVAP